MTIPSIDVYRLPEAAELPAPRLSWTFDPARAALLVHDMQRYFLDFYAGEFTALLDNIAALRDTGLPTVYTAQPPRQSPESRGLLSDRWGAGLQDREEIVAALAPKSSDTVLTKHRYSAFHRTELAAWLAERGRDQLVITGVYAHIGVTATALDAFAADVQPFVIADATADFTREAHLRALEHVAATCAVVTTTARLDPGVGLDEVRSVITSLLDEPVADDENLVDAGLDSIRVMGLIEDWKLRGHEVTFADLAAEPTILGFHAALRAAR